MSKSTKRLTGKRKQEQKKLKNKARTQKFSRSESKIRQNGKEGNTTDKTFCDFSFLFFFTFSFFLLFSFSLFHLALEFQFFYFIVVFLYFIRCMFGFVCISLCAFVSFLDFKFTMECFADFFHFFLVFFSFFFSFSPHPIQYLMVRRL